MRLSRKQSALVGLLVLALALVLIVLDLTLTKRVLGGSSFLVAPGADPGLQDYAARNGYELLEGEPDMHRLWLLLQALASTPEGSLVVALDSGTRPPATRFQVPRFGDSGELLLVSTVSDGGGSGSGSGDVLPFAPGIVMVRNTRGARRAVAYMWALCESEGMDEATAIAAYMRTSRLDAGLPMHVVPQRTLFQVAETNAATGLALTTSERYVDTFAMLGVTQARCPEGASSFGTTGLPSGLAQMAALEAAELERAAWQQDRALLEDTYRDAKAGRKGRSVPLPRAE